ncbi:MAG: hypothetical protein A2909_03185 [Candidatus Tagabacteria bacterium RIFCSPLOWO2_01_FULL_39_11]|uniref:Uncharacterized protein n=1 Tax=Candidatus Tagabacteria bacterium RIFCSPLOWO2_01_FULL_39_11 TaxID=1802295 RepID=A0A1G2LPV8_9BACT|nr:MAG: hypothetical protein A2909_03185 [Candidatus Tagabacteria bacterium RIFCSPLOWO2_01_FULL_39_11]
MTIVILFFLSSQNTLATQGPPSPVCEIEAVILRVGALDDVDIKITKIGQMIERGSQIDFKDFNCDTYKGQIIKNTSIRTEGDYKSVQTIKGQISWFADEFTKGFVLDDVEILSESLNDTTEPEPKIVNLDRTISLKEICLSGAENWFEQLGCKFRFSHFKIIYEMTIVISILILIALVVIYKN